MSSHTAIISCVRWGGEGLLYSSSRDTTINVWDAAEGKLVRQLKGHGHFVNSLALSSEYALRTGAYDHRGSAPADPQQQKQVGGWLLVGGCYVRHVWRDDSGTSAHKTIPTHPLEAVIDYSHAVSVHASPPTLLPAPGSLHPSSCTPVLRCVLCCQVALERYEAVTRGQPERLVSGSDDFTMFLWTPSTSKAHVARMTGHVQLINHVSGGLFGKGVGREGRRTSGRWTHGIAQCVQGGDMQRSEAAVCS
jgi:WD40 repeat protein